MMLFLAMVACLVSAGSALSPLPRRRPDSITKHGFTEPDFPSTSDTRMPIHFSTTQPAPRSEGNWQFPDYSPCDEGFEPLEGYPTCIKVHTSLRLTWKKAFDWCFSEHSRLVEIQNEYFSEALSKFLHNNAKKGWRYWTGVRKNAEDVWIYASTSTPLGDFHPWAYKEPNDHRKVEDCVEVIANKRLAWNDKRCTRKRSFVCQAPIRMAKK